MSSKTDGSAAERLFLEVRFGILRGDYLPGQFFERKEVCEAFDVTPRLAGSAFSTLASEGYVEYRRSVFSVKCWAKEEVDDIFDLRASIEGLAAFRAAERATEAEIENLKQMIVDSSDMSFEDPEDIERVTMEGIQFHVEILKMSKIPSIGEMARNVVPNAIHRRIVWAQHVRDARESARMHRKIADDIAARAGVRARGRMREDVYASREKVLEAVRELADRARPGHKASIVRYASAVPVGGRSMGIGRREMGVDGIVTPIGVSLKPAV